MVTSLGIAEKYLKIGQDAGEHPDRPATLSTMIDAYYIPRIVVDQIKDRISEHLVEVQHDLTVFIRQYEENEAGRVVTGEEVRTELIERSLIRYLNNGNVLVTLNYLFAIT
jgi:hypothetical protein